MLFIFDMDGVLYRATEPIPHAADAVDRLRRAGHTVRFLTNNSVRPRINYVPRLEGMGIPCVEDDVITSAYVLAQYFLEQGWQGTSVYVVGESGIRNELSAIAGCRFIEALEETADVVVGGIDRQFTYEKMKNAQQHVLRGAHFVATNRDPTFPVENGGLVPGAGSVVASLVTATGREPITVGKPNPFSVKMLSELTGIPMQDVVMIGDRLDTDIEAGRVAKVKTVLVMTGVTTPEELLDLPDHWTPDLILEDLSHLPAEWVNP